MLFSSALTSRLLQATLGSLQWQQIHLKSIIHDAYTNYASTFATVYSLLSSSWQWAVHKCSKLMLLPFLSEITQVLLFLGLLCVSSPPLHLQLSICLNQVIIWQCVLTMGNNCCFEIILLLTFSCLKWYAFGQSLGALFLKFTAKNEH